MICCEILRINGLVTHEIGCRNQGQVVTRHRFPKYYVGILKGGGGYQYFTTALEPSAYYFPEYGAVIGPFRTKRGAKWAAAHPFGWSIVSEAEEKAKADALNEVRP